MIFTLLCSLKTNANEKEDEKKKTERKKKPTSNIVQQNMQQIHFIAIKKRQQCLVWFVRVLNGLYILSHCWMFLFIFSCLTYWFVRRLKMDFFFIVLQISMLISATMSHHFWNPNQKYEQTRAYILRYIACVNVIQLKNALTLEIAHRASSKRNIDKFHNGILCIVRTKAINGIVQVKREREWKKR